MRAPSLDHEIMTWAEIESQTLKQPSHPAAPDGVIFDTHSVNVQAQIDSIPSVQIPWNSRKNPHLFML